jgi:hypothetical protein
MNFVRTITEKIKSYPMNAKITNPIVTESPNVSDIINSNIRYFPQEVRKYIIINTKYSVRYDFEIATVTFYTFENTIPLQKLNKYVKLVLCWISIAKEYSIHHCGNSLNVIFYMTPLKKILPNKGETLSSINCNTGFSSFCKEGNDIIIYRQEEWFKVFLHESFHYFGFDYSNMDVSLVNRELQKCFCITTDILLFESYTEFFAEILNLCFYCVIHDKDFGVYIKKEIKFSLEQSNKVLHHMELTYNDIFESCEESREKYMEDTNAFAYYILKTIFIFNWDEFINWCKKTNTNMLTFPQNNKSVVALCKWITDKCRDPNFLDSINNVGKKIDNSKSLRMTSTDL